MKRTSGRIGSTICFLLLLCLLGSAHAQQHPPEMLGKWCESKDGGASCYGYTSYFEDGTAFGYTLTGTGNRREMSGIWARIGSHSCFMKVFFREFDQNTNDVVDWGQFRDFCDLIISLEGDVFTYEDDQGEQGQNYRISITPDRSVWPPPTESRVE